MRICKLRKELFPLFCGLLLIASVVEARAQSVPDSAEKVHPLLVGAQVPDVNFKNLDGSSFNLRMKASEKPIILIFYRGGWCPFCNTHLGQLQKIEAQLIELGYQIVAVSPDKPQKLAATKDKQATSYTLVSDSDATGIKGFGIAYRMDDQTFDTYKSKYKIDLEEYSGATHHLLPAPAVFIVNTKGQILFQYVNPDYKVRLRPEILLAAAKAYARN